MADILIFDPNLEFEVLETFDFEEEVQRPSELRFFPLEEQLVDFFEKHLPAGKPTKFQLNTLRDYQFRLKTAYNDLIAISDTEYVVNTTRQSVNVPWIRPVYSSFDYKAYSYTKEFAPLFDKASRVKPNYYPLLINSLPSPYVSTGEGRPLDKDGELVDEQGENPIIGLTKFQRTRTLNKEDGTFDIKKVDIANTRDDDLKITGFFLQNRGVEIPNPLNDHPFLKSNKASFIKSDLDLLTIFPSVEAILEHAIPTTTDPYVKGKEFLKIYDLPFSQIPWSSWKYKFPPVDTVQSASIQNLIMPSMDEQPQPSEILQKVYTKWYNGYHQREWLSLQSDAGRFVQQLLTSDSSSNGILPLSSFEGPTPTNPSADSDICMSLMSDFDSFLSTGLYRPKFDKNGFDIGGTCVPIGNIQQEKYGDIYRNRIGWKESTENDIQTSYVNLLKLFEFTKTDKPDIFEKFGKLPESEKRKDILNILEDDARSPEDKADSIELIVRDSILENNMYNDAQSRFVVCLHTLSELRNDDITQFYRDWTSVKDGNRVCKYCSEVVSSEVLVLTEDFDDDGHIVVSRDVLKNTSINPFTNSILQLKQLFDMNNSGESVLYLLITLLQVIPYDQQLVPIIQLIRKITQSLKSKALSTKKISKSDQDRIEGILGVCGMVTLLQVHTPFLIPKKSVNNKPFNTTGYPRDSDDPKKSAVLDSVLITLKQTFESFQTELKGGIGALSTHLSNLSKVRTEALIYLAVFSNQFRLLFESAKERFVIPEDIEVNTIKFPILHPESVVDITDPSDAEFKDVRTSPNTSWTNKHPIMLTTPIKLEHVTSNPVKEFINTTVEKVKLSKLTDKEIQTLVSTGLPSGFPILSEFLKTDIDLGSLTVVTTRLMDILLQTKFPAKLQSEVRDQIVNIDYSESPSLLRDIVKGLLFKVLTEVKQGGMSRVINEALKTDLTLKMVLSSKEKAEQEEFTLRTSETNLLKQRYREMSDVQREITKMLVDIGISEFIVTNEDRERFAKQSEQNVEKEYIELEAQQDINRPEEGYDDVRDYIENGDLPQNDRGQDIDADRGDYGDRAVRDYNDYSETAQFEEES